MPKIILNQQDRDELNSRELGYMADFIFEKTKAAAEISAVMAVVKDFLCDKQLALSVDDHTLQLKELLYQIIRRKEQDQLAAALEKWAADYPSAAEKARQQGENNRRQHASQPSGIYRGLTEQHIINYKAWGEDLDILVALRQIITVSPHDISSDGTYIFSPVESNALEDKLREIAEICSDKKLTLLIPVNQSQRHWQLAKVNVVNGQVVDSYIWDAIKEGVQKNGYSCMDYTVREALRVKFSSEAAASDLQAIIDADNALNIREAIVNRILNVHEKMQFNPSLQASVHSQMSLRAEVEKFSRIPEDDENQLHAELVKNKDLQVEFDASMASRLEQLYKQNNGQQESQLFSTARKFAYQELLRKYGLFSESRESLSAQEARSIPRV